MNTIQHSYKVRFKRGARGARGMISTSDRCSTGIMVETTLTYHQILRFLKVTVPIGLWCEKTQSYETIYTKDAMDKLIALDCELEYEVEKDTNEQEDNEDINKIEDNDNVNESDVDKFDPPINALSENNKVPVETVTEEDKAPVEPIAYEKKEITQPVHNTEEVVLPVEKNTISEDNMVNKQDALVVNDKPEDVRSEVHYNPEKHYNNNKNHNNRNQQPKRQG